MNERSFKFTELFRCRWNPKPVDKPKVDPELPHLDPLTRSAESIRYSVLSIEFWISPNGQVREWLRHNSRLAAVLAVPAFMIIPVITFALWQLAYWMAALVLIAGKLVLFPILALVAILALTLTVNIIKSLFRR